MRELVRVNDHLSMNRGFGTRELNDALEKAMIREDEFKTKQSFAPSGLGYSGSCPRYWYYAFNGAVFSSNADALAVANMNQGSSAGERLAQLLDDAGLLVSAETEVNTIGHATYPPIRGYIDALINWKGEEVVVEVKTTNNNQWNWRVTKNEVPEYQMIQLLIYMYVTDHTGGFFMTENKDTNELFILPVRMTEENKALVERVFDWMRTVKDNADNGELPTRPFTQASSQCKGCAVRDTCWDGFKRGSVNGEDPNPGTINLEVLQLS